MKKALIVVSLMVLTVLFLLFFIKKPNKSYNPVSAIPKNATIIIKANGFIKVTTALIDNNFYQNIITDSIKNEIASLKYSLDSFKNENSSIKKVLSDSSIYFSFHFNKNNSNGINIYLPFGSLTDYDVVAARIYFFLKKRGIDLYKYNPLETKKERPGTVYYFAEKGILVLGNNLQNLQEAYVQVKASKNLYNDTSFTKVFATSGKNVSACIYLDMSKIQILLKHFFKPEFNKYIAPCLNTKGWTALDLNIDLNTISFHGFSDIKAQNQMWTKLLKNELPASNTIVSVFPQSTSYFSLIAANDFYNYKLAYKEKLKKDSQFLHEIKSLKNAFGDNIDDKLFDIVSGAVATCLTTSFNRQCCKFFIINTKNSIEPLVFINSFRKTVKSRESLLQAKTRDSSSVKPIFFKLPGNNLPMLFGASFDKLNYSYITNYKEFIILGESEQSLRNYIEEISKNKTILFDSAYRQVLSGAIASKSNVAFFINFSKVKGLIPEYVSEKSLNLINRSLFDKTSNSVAGLQLSGNGNYFYNNLFFYSEPTLAYGPELVWSVKLDTTPQIAPSILLKGNDQFYFVQDKKCSIYLLSSKGNILWKKTINEKILSSIYKIDYPLNGKEIIVFNTSENLYAINFEGENIKGFPVKFKSNATNGIAIADFDNNKNYRFYLANENKGFIALNINGKPVEGWKFTKTKGIVSKPAQCFTFKQKDYIVFFDSSNIYVLNRKGENRLKIKDKVSISGNNEIYVELRNSYFRLVSTDFWGNVNGIYPDGHIDEKNFGISTSNHYFLYCDLNKDRKPDYVFTDSIGIYAYDGDKKTIFSNKTPKKINQKPIIISDKEGKNFIAYTAGSKVYLTDAYGKLLKGFPINGNFPVNVLSLSDVSYSFAIFTSSEETVNCYYVH